MTDSHRALRRSEVREIGRFGSLKGKKGGRLRRDGGRSSGDEESDDGRRPSRSRDDAKKYGKKKDRGDKPVS